MDESTQASFRVSQESFLRDDDAGDETTALLAMGFGGDEAAASSFNQKKLIFIILVSLETLVLFGFEIYYLVVLPNGSELWKAAVLLMILTVGVGLLAIGAALRENKFQLFSFFLASAMVFGYSTYQYWILDPAQRTGGVEIARFALSMVFLALNFALGILVWRSFGWRITRKIGMDRALQKQYTSYQIFVSLLMLDLLLGVTGVVLLAIYQEIDYEVIIDICLMVVTLGWAFLGVVSAKREILWGMVVFGAFAFVQPAYMVAKIVINVAVDGDIGQSWFVPFLVLSCFSIVIRAGLIVDTVFLWKHFGGGLKEIFEEEKRNPVLNRILHPWGAEN